MMAVPKCWLRYGQTNCFVGAAITYGVFAVGDAEAYVCTCRAARNMAFQGIITPRGEVRQLLEIAGAKIVGTKIRAPFAITPEVYVLPMENVLATKVCRSLARGDLHPKLILAGNWRGHLRAVRLPG
jgi:hypothetical protein